MKRIAIAAAAAGLLVAGQASAADLISVVVSGPTGTFWTVGKGQDGYYTSFVSPVPGMFLNTGTNYKTLDFASASGLNNFAVFGESFGTPNSSIPSDTMYTLTLGFAGGATISGTYNDVTNTFTPSATNASANIGGSTYTLTGFQYNRGGGDVVGANSIGADGQGPDYSGLFSYSVAAAVPETATWGMMILGFGMMGVALRARKAKVTFA